MDIMISTADAAKITGHTPQHLSSLCKEGKIPGAVRIGRAYAVPRSWAEDIAAFNAATVTIKEATELAGVSRTAIIQAAHEGRLEKIGSRITRDSLSLYIEKRSEKYNDKP